MPNTATLSWSGLFLFSVPDNPSVRENTWSIRFLPPNVSMKYKDAKISKLNSNIITFHYTINFGSCIELLFHLWFKNQARKIAKNQRCRNSYGT